ncbi:MAG: TonB family protein [Fidelibacterota bacterium]
MSDTIIGRILVVIPIVLGPSLSMGNTDGSSSPGIGGQEANQDTIQQDDGVQTTTVLAARLRTEPRFGVDIRAVIPEGAVVTVYEYLQFEGDGFWHTRYGDEWGYVFARYLDVNDEMLKLMEKGVPRSPPSQARETEEFITFELRKTPAARGGFTLTVNPAVMGSGTALHLLDEILQRSDVLDPGTLNYHLKTTRKSLDLDRAIAPLMSIHYDFGNRWKMYGDLFVFSTRGSRSGTFESPEAPTGVAYINAVYLWDGNFRLPSQRSFWFQNDKYPSGMSPLDWSGQTTFRMAYGHASVSYLLTSGPHREVAAEAGLSVSSMNRTLRRSLEGVAYLFTPDLDGDGFPDDFDLDGTVEEFQNNVSLKTDNRTTASLSFGPRVGMRGGFTRHRWAFRGTWAKSWVRQGSDIEGTFTDIDNMKWIDPVTGITEGIYELKGGSSYEDRVEAVVRINEVFANISYEVTDGFHVGLGVYSTLWENVPAIPTFNYRDGTWRLAEDTFFLYGINLAVSFDIEPPRSYRRTLVPVTPLPGKVKNAPDPTGGYEAIMEKVVYPEAARRSQTEGTVLVRAFVDHNGIVTRTVVKKGMPGSGLNEAAENAVRGVLWKPATQDGQPVGMWIVVPVEFELE